jgi:hypothetical protein
MTPLQLATLIGNILTQLDTELADPDFPMSSPKWQTLYALRKHLDDLQRSLIRATIASGNPQYAGLTTQINNASTRLETVIGDLTKVDPVIRQVSQIASVLDQILQLIP